VTTVAVAYPPAVDDAVLASLRERFPDVEFVAAPYAGRFSRYGRYGKDGEDELTDERREVWARADIALALDLPDEIASIAPHLRWVQAIGAGIEHLDGVALPPGCLVTNAAGVAAAPIAEFALARILAVWKRLPEIEALQRERRWKPCIGRTAEGATIGIVGFGAIGTAVAVRARAFGMTVLAIRRSHTLGQEHPDAHEMFGPHALHDVLPRCDAIVAALPATGETENLFDARAFAAMRAGALFCNVGRGALVDEPALIDALESGHLGAAILDVTRQEPLPPEDPLWTAPNAYLSPHSSAALDRYADKLRELFADNLSRFFADEPLRNVVDRGAGY
jgi:phosphoglycerate dehydrogenase-like enzyme